MSKRLEPIRDQGQEAFHLGLKREDCPYADGANREAWLEAYNLEADAFVVAPAPEPSE